MSGVRLAGSLVHPNVITVFDYFEHDGTPYIAMEYVDRGSLRPYVGRMTIAQIGGVLEGVLAGLAEAERHNIVHRDLKPENLMVTATGTVKIADFGIAKATQVADTGAFVTATGTTVGTPPYMAPEQAMAKDVGAWTDLYSVGCMAYELFTGKPPFSDTEEALAILLRHISEALPPVSEVAGVDPDISAWIERVTAKEPAARPESATAAWEELEEILIGKLGPRWRREARLPEPPNRAAEAGPLSPATPPPAGPAPPMEGIDVEGTGPDTGGDMPGTETPAPRNQVPRPPPPPTGRRRWRASTSRGPARTGRHGRLQNGGSAAGRGRRRRLWSSHPPPSLRHHLRAPPTEAGGPGARATRQPQQALPPVAPRQQRGPAQRRPAPGRPARPRKLSAARRAVRPPPGQGDRTVETCSPRCPRSRHRRGPGRLHRRGGLPRALDASTAAGG